MSAYRLKTSYRQKGWDSNCTESSFRAPMFLTTAFCHCRCSRPTITGIQVLDCRIAQLSPLLTKEDPTPKFAFQDERRSYSSTHNCQQGSKVVALCQCYKKPIPSHYSTSGAIFITATSFSRPCLPSRRQIGQSSSQCGFLRISILIVFPQTFRWRLKHYTLVLRYMRLQS